MPIVYRQHFTAFQHEHDALCAGRQILLFDPVLERSADTPGDRFRRLDAMLRHVDLVVFRVADEVAKRRLSDDPILRERASHTPVAALLGGMEPSQLAPRLEFVFEGAQCADLPQLEDLRQAEVLPILFRTGAIFRNREHHFELPSGRHADQFVRIACALRDVVEVRRMTDWIMPFVTPKTMVLADSGSILPLLAEIAYRSLRLFRWEIPADCLEMYPVRRDLVDGRIADLFARHGDDRQLLFKGHVRCLLVPFPNYPHQSIHFGIDLETFRQKFSS